MKNKFLSFIPMISVLWLSCWIISAQDHSVSDITDAYETYSEAPRELAYVHLNKSTYLQGEMMGFTAYIFNKASKRLSKSTKNLYGLYNFQGLNKTTILDEVVLQAKLDKEQKRRDKIKLAAWQDAYFIDEDDIRAYSTITDFINFSTNLRVFQDPTEGIIICNPRSRPSIQAASGSTNSYSSQAAIPNCNRMNIFVDDVFLFEHDPILFSFLIQDIDYIEVNRTGFGEGLLAGNGTVRIYTKRDYSKKAKNQKKYKLNFSFSKNKTFYTPRYSNYQDRFFINYGVIDWKPNLSVDTIGNVTFSIKTPEVPFTLFIEGVNDNGTFFTNTIHTKEHLKIPDNK